MCVYFPRTLENHERRHDRSEVKISISIVEERLPEKAAVFFVTIPVLAIAVVRVHRRGSCPHETHYLGSKTPPSNPLKMETFSHRSQYRTSFGIQKYPLP